MTEQGIKGEIKRELTRLRDEKYRDFQGGLIPTVARERFLGVRTPDLRRLAKELSRREDISVFLNSLPHDTFDEDQLHAFIISEIKDFSECLMAVEAFLPYVDNWATCDQLSPKVFMKKPEALLPSIERWMASGRTYTVRFGIGMLMRCFLNERFDPLYLERVAAVCSGEYYIDMMVAWYFATALAKHYEEALVYLTEGRLSPFVRRKAIQKALESYRVSEEHKGVLRSMR